MSLFSSRRLSTVPIFKRGRKGLISLNWNLILKLILHKVSPLIFWCQRGSNTHLTKLQLSQKLQWGHYYLLCVGCREWMGVWGEEEQGNDFDYGPFTGWNVTLNTEQGHNFGRMLCAFLCHLQYVLFRKVRVQNPTSARSYLWCYIQFERLDDLLECKNQCA